MMRALGGSRFSCAICPSGRSSVRSRLRMSIRQVQFLEEGRGDSQLFEQRPEAQGLRLRHEVEDYLGSDAGELGEGIGAVAGGPQVQDSDAVDIPQRRRD